MKKYFESWKIVLKTLGVLIATTPGFALIVAVVVLWIKYLLKYIVWLWNI